MPPQSASRLPKSARPGFVCRSRLFAYLENHCGGLPARVRADNRFKEYWPKWSQAPELRTETKERAAG
jgi:hypothetical protein